MISDIANSVYVYIKNIYAYIPYIVLEILSLYSWKNKWWYLFVHKIMTVIIGKIRKAKYLGLKLILVFTKEEDIK